MTTLSPCFEWPPDVEAAIYDRIRPHVHCGLKRRTWHAVHAELRKTVPRHEGRFVGRDGSCFLIRSNDEPVGLPEHRFAVIHVADPPLPHALQAFFDSLGEEHGQFLLAWMSHSLFGVGTLRGG